MTRKMHRNNRLLRGVLSGFAVMVFLGWIPIIGPVLSGLIAGIVTKRGALYGMLSGLLAGIAGSIAVIFALLLFLRPLFHLLLAVFAIDFSAMIILIGFTSVLLSATCGYIGGALREKTKY
ncbi:MAG: DUF5518 domain-containing protein [Candidatus Marsarchaeota archaeon]|nr:DUF5518 domain-containing protein [Candidatus Marsarchaeota archaeon]MCL5105815.1 DUF5518 domain-containing protein [Candidatus Marsarchaeota archaeon]